MTLVEDKRAKKIAFVAHCILNQNAKVNGFAFYPAMIFEMAKVLHKFDFGLVQLPCPETTYAGTRRWWYVKEQYDNPGFREHCRRILEPIFNQIEEYGKEGYKIVIIGLDGSPSCGVKISGRSDKWGGPPEIPSEERENYPTAKRPGVFMEELFKGIEARGLEVPKAIGAGFDIPGFKLEEEVAKLEKFLSEYG